MKLLTLNTHSLIEDNYETKLKQFVEMVLKELPDVIALQEVNQSLKEPEADSPEASGYVPCEGNEKKLRKDNHALRAAQMLESYGRKYFWTWIPFKIGYGIYEEGLALFSRKPIEETKEFFISKIQKYSNWKSRKLLGIRVENTWFCSVHMGWWDDDDDPFETQWEKIQWKLYREETCYVMGDFNSPAGVPGEGYDYVKESGWHDTYELASEKDSGITVGKVIDGWRERLEEGARGMRIDYIWSSSSAPVKSSRVVFNGENYPVVSDHYGVEAIIDTE